tara:strand:- start:7217 stop:7381 length:165 start_codon:yes stop_codon:yes gene_type:complete
MKNFSGKYGWEIQSFIAFTCGIFIGIMNGNWEALIVYPIFFVLVMWAMIEMGIK